MSFIREWSVKSIRKACACDVCGKRIEIGETAVRWAGMTDGDFGSAVFHPECRAAEVEHNRANGAYADEWYSLADEGTREVRDWLVAEHPVVAARMFALPPSGDPQ